MDFLQKKDGLAGLLMALWGLFVSTYALANYPIGTLARLGPGLYPTALGVLLTVLGMAVLIRSRWQKSETIEIDIKTMLLVLGSLGAGALMVEFFGVIPAAVTVVLISSAASGKMSFWSRLVYSAVLVGSVIILFLVVLRLNLVLVRWPL